MHYTQEMILHSDSGYCMPFEERNGEVNMSLGYGKQKHPHTGESFFHHGVDFKVRNYLLSAVATGKVTGLGNDAIHGIYQITRYGDYEVTYAHLSNVFTNYGKEVKAGQVIAVSADSLHVEVKYKGEELNPLEFLTMIYSNLKVMEQNGKPGAAPQFVTLDMDVHTMYDKAMVESKQDKIFNTKVIPIMNKVRNDLQNKLADELRSNSNSFAGLMAAAAGPDGGMASMQAQNDTLKYTGKWTSKTTEDYIAMVKKELKRQHITVNASMEQKMIDKMIKDKIPKSSIDYIIRKAATSTIFYLPQDVSKSPLDHKIDSEAEKRYKPSVWEKNAGIALGSVTDLACMGGLGGGLKTAATWIGSDMFVTHVGDKLNDRSDVPMIIAPGKEDEYRRTQQEKKKQAEQKPQNKPQSEEAQQAEPTEEVNQSEGEASNTQPEQTNMNGWQGLLTSFGLNGISDIGHNLGYVLAMLPDMLVGMFTGKTKSINIKDNMMPIASIVAGMFVKNPILKMVLIGMGGMNLLYKAGHEALDNFKAQDHPQQAGGRINYRIYPEEPLNARIQNPEIRANCLIANIDRVPCTIALPERVVDAYRQGALPLNTLANAVLAKNDQMRQIASEKYEAGERQTVIERPLAQR